MRKIQSQTVEITQLADTVESMNTEAGMYMGQISFAEVKREYITNKAREVVKRLGEIRQEHEGLKAALQQKEATLEQKERETALRREELELKAKQIALNAEETVLLLGNSKPKRSSNNGNGVNDRQKGRQGPKKVQARRDLSVGFMDQSPSFPAPVAMLPFLRDDAKDKNEGQGAGAPRSTRGVRRTRSDT
jgi:hypothetical protein